MRNSLLIIILIFIPLNVHAKDNQAVWSKNEETETKNCQIAIEQGKAVSLKTSKSLERTAYLYNGNFYMLTDYNEMIICFKYSQKEIKIK
tara:strand:- start:750 stop:1019 length:270 start_codon:yes stop_codon:yes gene_type:complete